MTPTCLICDKTWATSTRKSANIFKEQTSLGEPLADLLSEILEKPISEEGIYTDVLCMQCQKVVLEYDSIRVRLEAIKTDLISEFKNTLPKYDFDYETFPQKTPKTPVKGLTGSTDKSRAKVVLSASKLQPLPPDYVINMNVNELAGRLNLNPKVVLPRITSIKSTAPTSNTLNLKVTVGSTVLTHTVSTSSPSVQNSIKSTESSPTKCPAITEVNINELLSKRNHSLMSFNVDSLPKDFMSSSVMKGDGVKEEGDVINDDQPMEIDEECTSVKVTGNERVRDTAQEKMIPENVKYYVVEISEDSLKSLDKYVCIPFSWIKYRETADSEVLIKYPIEKKLVTKRRVQIREEPSEDWPIFSADIKLCTNSYKGANNYIKILKQISELEESKKVESAPSTSGLTSETLSNKTSEQASTGSKESQDETKVGDSPKAKRYFTRLTSKVASPANTVSVDQTVENDAPETSSCSKETVQYIQKENSSVQSYEKFTEEFILREALRQVLGDDYKEIVGLLYAEYCKRYKLFQMLCHDALQHCKTFKELKEISDSDNDGQEVIPNKKMKVTRSEVQHNDDTDVTDEDDKSESNNTSDKIRGLARKFILPPEYDPEDSKWTLKHPEYKEGLVELIPKSNIYVDANKLSECKDTARDSKSFARMLLVEVFRESALSICSPTGKRANAFTGTGVRPGLDEHARNVLLKFVDRQTVAQKWVRLDRATILNTLRNKMQEMRGKYGQRLCRTRLLTP